MSAISQTLCWILYLHSFPGGSDGIESACNVGDLGLIPGLGRSPWRRKWQLAPVFLPGKSHGQSSLVGYSPWSCEKLDKTERLSLSLLIDILSVCLEGSVSLRSLEINKLINKPCPHCRSDGRKNINHQWGRYNKPTGFYTGNFDCSK